MIDVWGADHSGYIKRMQAGVTALTEAKGHLEVRICQMVSLMRGGTPVKMSKRSGSFITLSEVIEEVGKDVVRFIMLTRKNDAPLEFDLEKVVEQTRDNPVFYVHYAHARCCSVLRHAAAEFPQLDQTPEGLKASSLSLLTDSNEVDLLRLMAEWPRLLEGAAEAREPHRVAFYLTDVAADMHGLWTMGKGRSDDKTLALESGPRPRSRIIPILLCVVALNAFGTVIWYAYNWGKGSLDDGALPVVTADGDPIKVRPAEEGDLVILHQDKLVLNSGLEGSENQVVEHLLAPPEVPQDLGFSKAKEEGGEIATLGHQLQASKPSPAVAVVIVEAEEVAPPSAPAPTPKSMETAIPAPAPTPKSMETAIPAPAVQVQSAQVPTNSGFLLQLAALQDAGAAKTEWARLQKAHPQLLGSLTVSYEKAVVGGKTYYRILTGPFPTRATVEDLCAQLKSKKQSCFVKKQAP